MKPLKASTDILPLDHPLIPYEQGVVSSTKFDGNRGLCICGELYTSDMKEVRSEEFHELMEPLKLWTMEHGLMFDYEIFSPSQDHHAATSGILNSFAQPLPDDVTVNIFDGCDQDEWHDQCHNLPYRRRIQIYTDEIAKFKAEACPASLADKFVAVEQRPVANAAEALALYEADLEAGFEGSMLRALDIWWDGNRVRGGFYKHGRCSNTMRCIYKAKPYETGDGYIIGVQQRRVIKADWPRRRDASGRLVRPNEIAAYDLTDMIGTFIVRMPLENGEYVDTEIGFRKGFDFDWRKAHWTLFKEDPTILIGQWVEFKHMPHGAKTGGALRAGGLVRFRKDLAPLVLSGGVSEVSPGYFLSASASPSSPSSGS